MNSLKITEFFETDLLHNFYSRNDKDMSLGNLDSCHHTPNRIKVKKKEKPCKFQCTSSFTRMHSLNISDFF